MSRSRKQPYHVTEHGGNRYASLEEAQAAALPILVQSLAEAVREGIEKGQLVVLREGNKNVVRVASHEAE